MALVRSHGMSRRPDYDHRSHLDVAYGSSRRVRLLNQALLRAWASRYAQVPSLHPAKIIEKARLQAKAPTMCFPTGWEHRLEHILHDLHTNAALTPLGRTIAHGQLVAAASSMLGMEQLWKKHPPIRDIPIRQPVIVVGQMRSGTTRVQRLLACDHRLRFTRFYESWTPLPSANLHRLLDDRPWRARTALAIAHIANPPFKRLHPTGARQPDEEIGLFNILMLPAALEAQWRIPAFVRHCEAMDKIPLYDLFKRMLQTIAWLRGKPDERPWIMKVPQFSEDLAALLTVFPDARIVLTSRPNEDVLTSTKALVYNQMSLQSASVDPTWIEQEWRRKIALRETRMATALAPHIGPTVRLDFDAVGRDWEGAVSKIYTMLDMPLIPEVHKRMKGYQSRVAAASV